jgi:hypothetical protein
MKTNETMIFAALEYERLFAAANKGKEFDFRRIEFMQNVFNDAGGWHVSISDFLFHLKKIFSSRELRQYKIKSLRRFIGVCL